MLEPVTLTLTGLESLIERVVEEKLRALAQQTDGWLTAPEAAEYLGIAVSTLHDLVCDGLLARHGPRGSRLRFLRDDLDVYARRRD